MFELVSPVNQMTCMNLLSDSRCCICFTYMLVTDADLSPSSFTHNAVICPDAATDTRHPCIQN